MVREAGVLKWISYYVPIVHWLPVYSPSFLLWDVLAGAAVAAMLLPHSLSYATLAGLHPVYGLYAAGVPLLVYVVFGSSPQLSVGPDALVALLVGSYVKRAGAGVAPEAAAAALTLVVGVVCMLLGLVRFGFLENVLSSSILVGYRLGVAIVLVCDQLDALFGLPQQAHVSDYASIRKIGYVFTHFGEASGLAIACSLSSLVFLVATYWLKQRVVRAHKGRGSYSQNTKKVASNSQ